MYLILIFKILSFLLFEFTKCDETKCTDSQQHFANLCFSPQPFSSQKFNRTENDQQPDGWYGVLGNDILRLHHAEGLKGELLPLTDNFDDICVRVKGVYSDNPDAAPGGKFFGFGNLTSDWNCTYSSDFPGVLFCDNINPGLTKYHENFKIYIIRSVNNIHLAIYCFPNGQVGWGALSKDKTITDAENKMIIDQITSLGFSNNNTVSMYNEENCSSDK